MLIRMHAYSTQLFEKPWSLELSQLNFLIEILES